MKKKVNKKAALELSIGTIVILVLAMTMLIMGLVLVRTIFTGAKYNVDQMNSKVKDEISKLFVEDQKMIIYLENNKVDIKQGEDWGIGVLLRNNVRDSSEVSKFSYKVSMIENSCNLKETEAMSWIKLGKQSLAPMSIAPGDSEGWVIRFSIPENAPLCLVRYNIEIQMNSLPYDSGNFDLSVEAK